MQQVTHTKDNLVACICEGTSERVIMEKLLQADKLIFTEEELLNDEILGNSMRKAKVFQDTFLGLQLPSKIEVFRIVDSLNEKFVIEKLYKEKISGIYAVVTKPEIEMLIIHNEGKYEDFLKTKSKMKPSTYCKTVMKYKNVKNTGFIEEYFSDIDLLIRAIETYHSKRGDKSTLTLKDLLK